MALLLLPAPERATLSPEAVAADALLPRTGAGAAAGAAFLLPFLLSALRPGARKWLGSERLGALARLLKLREQAVAQMLDAPPGLPEALRETGIWTGRRVPLLLPGGGLGWIDLHWRPDTQAQGNGLRPPSPANGSFAVRLDLPATGTVEIRGRVEGQRLDAVAEVERSLPKPVMADMEELLATTLARLGLAGRLTVRCGRGQFRT